ncbi:MAG: hypothetical protein GXX93_09120 [Anaerolineae bacterium]|nr:hypothetical protein [Anaerolineae bacterium]
MGEAERLLPLVELSPLPLILANAGAWFAFQFVIGYLVARLDGSRLDSEGALFRSRRWEEGGRFYQRHFRVRRWKALLPSGGKVFGDFSLSRVESSGGVYLRRWLAESCRAELSHWLALLPVVFLGLWNPPVGWAINLAYAVVANLPCIISQRYNRPRVWSVMERRGLRAKCVPKAA